MQDLKQQSDVMKNLKSTGSPEDKDKKNEQIAETNVLIQKYVIKTSCAENYKAGDKYEMR